MKFGAAVWLCALIGSSAAASINDPRHVERVEVAARSDEHELYKRRGGGGGGGRGGGGGGGGSRSGGGSSSGGGSRGGSSSGSGGSSNSGSNRGSSRPGSSGSGSSGTNRGGSSSGSNAGGSSSRGTGPQPAYGGGRYYGGGAAVPYRSGGRSPGGILPFVLIGGALAFWPGYWLYGAHMYRYGDEYEYYNVTTGKNESRPIICACAQYSVCGCDDNDNTEYYDELIGNGSYAALNKTVVDVAKVNGTMTILINGTLPNGTTVPEDEATAEDDSSSQNSSGDSNSAGAGMRTLIEALGFWPAVAAVMVTVFAA